MRMDANVLVASVQRGRGGLSPGTLQGESDSSRVTGSWEISMIFNEDMVNNHTALHFETSVWPFHEKNIVLITCEGQSPRNHILTQCPCCSWLTAKASTHVTCSEGFKILHLESSNLIPRGLHHSQQITYCTPLNILQQWRKQHLLPTALITFFFLEKDLVSKYSTTSHKNDVYLFAYYKYVVLQCTVLYIYYVSLLCVYM